MPYDNNWLDLCIPTDLAITDAIKVIESSGSKVCLVVQNSQNSVQLKGIITDGDVRRGILSGIDLNDKCTRVMNDKPFKMSSSSSVSEIEQSLTRHQIRHIPIVSQKGHLNGLYYSEATNFLNFENILFVIMAGGFGTRLKPYTDQIPKPMVQVKGKPMVQHIIERAKSAGFCKFALILHHLPEVIIDYFGDGSKFGVSIEYVEEKDPLGTAGGLSLLKLKNTDYSNILVTNCDLISNVDYRDVVKYHIKNDAFATMSVRQQKIVNEFGTVDVSGNLITGFTEKPVTVTNINAGIYVLSKGALELLDFGQKIDMPDLFLKAVSNEKRALAYYVYEDWSDIGREADLMRINRK